MAKYLVNWETDMSRWPAGPKERAEQSIKMAEKIKQDMKEGKTSRNYNDTNCNR